MVFIKLISIIKLILIFYTLLKGAAHIKWQLTVEEERTRIW